MGNKKNFKMAGFFLLLITLIPLTACGSNQETVTYKLEKGDNSVEVTLVAEDEEIIEQSSTSITFYDNIRGVESKEDAEVLITPTAEPLQGIDGLDYKLDFQDDHFIETIKVDFSIADASDLPGLHELLENEEGNLNLEDAVKSLEERGFEKVEE
ncbi:YehR family protein [Oceanobacillus sojae]|uniref:YehR family protein n=1 Tax=Oceanobacillus sojae TaxID=582851 RepID=UPI0021A78DB4|nr:YehR family protein [Oceanobacillus sojae]MCT1902475.1 YehR family protein [Oceanobacillus sojae]